ncbi:MAG TPA: rhodanese-like domain-containing protein [Nocardioidaceae bacterium]
MTSTLTEVRRCTVETLKERLNSEDAPRVLDVRTPAEFESAHIPGSYNVPLDNLKEHRAELRRHLDQDVVLVCLSGGRAEQAEKALAEAGLPGLHVLEGGMAAWTATGAPVTRGRQTWELERQVRLGAGALVLTSILGSVAAPRLKWLAAGVGTGLIGAAVTNTCTMGMLLSKMPWNQRGAGCDVEEVIKSLVEAA